jgi:hypothetical protein
MRLNKNMAGEKISKADLKAQSSAGSGFKIDPNAFDTQAGQLFAGLNILKLEPNEAAGPFVLKSILKDQHPGKKKSAAAKIKEPVDIYVATFGDVEVRMPLAKAFVMKAKDANLSVGDTFLVKRIGDYETDFGGTGKGYIIKVTERKK